MLKKTITYTDYNGAEHTEDFYFNLSKAEIAEIEMTTEGGFAEKLQKIVDNQDAKGMIDVFKNLILKSYGVKSEDGKRFIKSEDISNSFYQSEAYSQLFMDLITNPDEATIFVKGVMPSDLVAAADQANSRQNLSLV